MAKWGRRREEGPKEANISKIFSHPEVPLISSPVTYGGFNLLVSDL